MSSRVVLNGAVPKSGLRLPDFHRGARGRLAGAAHLAIGRSRWPSLEAAGAACLVAPWDTLQPIFVDLCIFHMHMHMHIIYICIYICIYIFSVLYDANGL